MLGCVKALQRTMFAVYPGRINDKREYLLQGTNNYLLTVDRC